MKTTLIRYRRSILMVAAIAMASPTIAVGAQPSRLTGDLTIGGTGAALGTMRQLADEFRKRHPDVRVRTVPSLGSTGGIKAVLAGQLSLSVSGRALTEAEAAKGLVGARFARTPFVFATGKKIAADDVTLDELAAIYSSKKVAWPDGTAIRPVLRPTADIDTALAAGMTPQLADALKVAHQRDGKNVAITDTDMADQLEQIPGAIGTSSLALILSEGRSLKVLSIAGMPPTLANLASGKYPYEKSQFVVFSTNADPLVQEFVRFIGSPAGAVVLRSTGNMPTDASDSGK